MIKLTPIVIRPVNCSIKNPEKSVAVRGAAKDWLEVAVFALNALAELSLRQDEWSRLDGNIGVALEELGTGMAEFGREITVIRHDGQSIASQKNKAANAENTVKLYRNK
jgi:hypothetical protein